MPRPPSAPLFMPKLTTTSWVRMPRRRNRRTQITVASPTTATTALAIVITASSLATSPVAM